MHMGIYPTADELIATEEKLHIGIDADHHETPISLDGFMAIVLDYEVKPLVQDSSTDRRFVRALRKHFLKHANLVEIRASDRIDSASSFPNSPQSSTPSTPTMTSRMDVDGLLGDLRLPQSASGGARELFAMLSGVAGKEGEELRLRVVDVMRTMAATSVDPVAAAAAISQPPTDAAAAAAAAATTVGSPPQPASLVFTTKDGRSPSFADDDNEVETLHVVNEDSLITLFREIDHPFDDAQELLADLLEWDVDGKQHLDWDNFCSLVRHKQRIEQLDEEIELDFERSVCVV